MSYAHTSHAEEPEFLDIVYDWMNRAPWLAISAAAHVIVFLILAIVPWSLIQKEETHEIIATLEKEPPEIHEPPPEEPLPPIETPELPTEDPDIIPTEEMPIEDPITNQAPTFSPDFDDNTNESPFENLGDLGILGIGGNSGGTGSRFSGPGGGGVPRGFPYGEHTRKALSWLALHQSEDGSWDSDGYSANCGEIGAGQCEGGGESVHDVGVTGLALLAFLGAGNTTVKGHFQENVSRGVRWLELMQDPDSGLLGDQIGHAYLYNHAIATLALCEAYTFSPTPTRRRVAQRAVNYITRARNPYGAWRYECPPIGDNDTSVSGWMIFALHAAEEAGLEIDERAYTDVTSFFDEVTDRVTGRTGYDTVGSSSSRIPGVNDHFPTEGTESMTAVSLLCRIFMGEEPQKNELLQRQADLLRRALPDPDQRDMYYWYYGTYAMYQFGGKHWRSWSRALEDTILTSQRKDGDYAGSWDPDGAWGFSGGRVYSTAMMALSLEVNYRYSRLTGTR